MQLYLRYATLFVFEGHYRLHLLVQVGSSMMQGNPQHATNNQYIMR